MLKTGIEPQGINVQKGIVIGSMKENLRSVVVEFAATNGGENGGEKNGQETEEVCNLHETWISSWRVWRSSDDRPSFRRHRGGRLRSRYCSDQKTSEVSSRRTS